jgi:hypothetical protein
MTIALFDGGSAAAYLLKEMLQPFGREAIVVDFLHLESLPVKSGQAGLDSFSVLGKA